MSADGAFIARDDKIDVSDTSEAPEKIDDAKLIED
jgi:hypothetical protein